MSQLLRGAACAAVTIAVISATSARAQAFPNINKAKEAATRSVEATNRHTAAETADQSPQPAATTLASAGSVKTAATVPEKTGPGTARQNKIAAPAGTAAPTASKSEISLVRETFNYTADGRRDPFMSLMKTGELRPAVSDLKLSTVIYDPAGRSVAILRDITTKEQYRVKVGQTLGRMRVASIQPKSVTFTVIAIGTTFQEVLALNDTTRARTQ
jgi:hypothetical protein